MSGLEAASSGPKVVVHSPQPEVARTLDAVLEEIKVVAAPTGDDVGRLLADGEGVALLVSHHTTPGRRPWRMLELIRADLPRLPILAYLEDEAYPWDDDSGRCPATVVVRAPSDPHELARLCRVAGRFGDQEAEGPGPDGHRSFAVVGLGGGVGATTIAAILARRAAESAPVVLADLDARHGTLALAMRVTPTYTVDDLRGVTGDPVRLDEALAVCLVDAGERLRMLAGAEAPFRVLDLQPIRSLLASLTRQFGMVVADLGDLPLANYSVLAETTDVVLVASHDVVSARRITPALTALGTTARATRVHLLLNGVEENVGADQDDLARAMNCRWEVVVHRSADLRRAWNDTAGKGLAGHENRALRSVTRNVGKLLTSSESPRRRNGAEALVAAEADR